MSQEELASEAEISVRHLSYVETGRSVPSRDLVVAVACKLQVADVGLFLESAGYVAPYPDADPMTPELEHQLRRLVDGQTLPALVHDRFGSIVTGNAKLRAAVRWFGVEAPFDVPTSGHLTLGQLQPFIVNWPDIERLYRRRLFRELVRGNAELIDEMIGQLYNAIGGDADGEPPSPLTPFMLQCGDTVQTFDLVTSTLGTPQEIMLRNFRLVQMLPRDDSARAWLDALPNAA